MSEDLKKLTDWGRFKTLLTDIKKESSPTQPLAFFPFSKLEGALKKEFSTQTPKIEEFLKNFKNSWKELNHGNLHLDCNLRNSYYSEKFTQVLRDELCKFSQDAFFIHAKKIQNKQASNDSAADSAVEFEETLSEIKRSIPLQSTWLRILFITHAESLSEGNKNKLQAFLAQEEKVKRHLVIWLSQSESTQLLVSHNEEGNLPSNIVQFQFEPLSPDETATILLHELSFMSRAYGLTLNYIDPELLAQWMFELQKATKGSDFPILQMIEHHCAGHFLFARDQKFRDISLSKNWTGEITVEESHAKKIA